MRIEHITTEEQKMKKKRANTIFVLILSIIGAVIFYLITKKVLYSLIAFASLTIILNVYLAVRIKVQNAADIKKMEEVFPDFIELMSSNLRAGMTVDKALLLSARKEFAPLDVEINNVGKDIVTGKEINQALKDMGQRINSEKIKKTIDIIISGIVSGGNLSVLLEETAITMRERKFIEKKASSNVLMYVIFIFFAVSIGAPMLFALSTVLVKVLTSILSGIPSAETLGAASSKLPFTLTKISVSTEFINYFALTFLCVTDILASLVLGLVGKGEEKEGVKYIVPILIISITVFFIVKAIMTSYLSGFF